MEKTDFRIQMNSLQACVHHLQTLDLDGLAEASVEHGSIADAALIHGVRGWVARLPPTHP